MNDKEYKIEIGKRIAKARANKGWSLTELAEASGLGRSAIGNYEVGDRMPGPGEINALAPVLDVSGAYLMCLEDFTQTSELDGLSDMFREAVRIQIQRYKELAEKIPASILHIYQRPTKENFDDWEKGIEESYRKYVQGEPSKPDAVEKHVTIRIEGGKKKKSGHNS